MHSTRRPQRRLQDGRRVDRLHTRVAGPTTVVSHTNVQHARQRSTYTSTSLPTSTGDRGLPGRRQPQGRPRAGFDMIGEVRRGPGWRDRDDDRYNNPIAVSQSGQPGLAYVRSRTLHCTQTSTSLVSSGSLAPMPMPIPDVADMDTLVEAPPKNVCGHVVCRMAR